MSVLVVQRWILARLRNRQFFSLRELNAAIAELLVDLNRRPFTKLPGCRAEALQSIDRPAMKRCRRRGTSMPNGSRPKSASTTTSKQSAITTACRTRWWGEHVMVRATDATVECFFKGGRVAAHVRSYVKGKHTTLPEDMPSAHRKHMK
jgi:hypothetical protein